MRSFEKIEKPCFEKTAFTRKRLGLMLHDTICTLKWNILIHDVDDDKLSSV